MSAVNEEGIHFRPQKAESKIVFFQSRSRTSSRLRCHSSRVKAFAAISSAAFSSGRLDKAQEYAPVLYERDGPTADWGCFGRAFSPDTRTQRRHAGLNRRAPGRSRVRAALLPVRQELGLGRSQDRRPAARRDAEDGIDVHGDRLEPSQFRFAMPTLHGLPSGASDGHGTDPS
jgi:hypothetical protein